LFFSDVILVRVVIKAYVGLDDVIAPYKRPRKGQLDKSKRQ